MLARRWFVLALVVLCLTGVGAAQAGDLPRPDPAPEPKGAKSSPRYTGPKRRLAVVDLEIKIAATATSEPTGGGGVISTTSVNLPPPSDFGTGLTEMLTTALVNSGRFIVLERKALADIQTEQQLGETPSFDPTSKAELGRLLGAQALVRGAVTEFTYQRSSLGGSGSFLKGVNLGLGKASAMVALDIRLYDVTTGRVLDSVRAEGRASSSGAAIDVQEEEYKMAASGFSQTPLGAATRQAVERAVAFIVKRMEEVPWEGRIAAVETDESGELDVYINAGSSAGIREGDQFEVFRPGRPIVDPETKVVIGRAKDKRLGVCRVVSETKELATAAVVEGTGFRAGDVVKLIAASRESPAPPAPGRK